MKRLATISRFLWRLKLLRFGLQMWRASRLLDNRPPTESETRHGLEIANRLRKEHFLK